MRTMTAKQAKRTSRKPLARGKDTRPMPGYPIPKTTATRTYLIGNQHTFIHVTAKDKRSAIAYYRKRINELLEGLRSAGHSTYAMPPLNPQVCSLLR